MSNGCVEDDLIARVREEDIRRSLPEIVTYGITAGEAQHFGLPCGGTIQLAKLHGPIGLYIGSRTSSEIAISISILAGMTAVKNGVSLPSPHWKCSPV
jgi:xanthine/CO dehydrogenase XdhC/CoxF family maturation factor